MIDSILLSVGTSFSLLLSLLIFYQVLQFNKTKTKAFVSSSAFRNQSVIWIKRVVYIENGESNHSFQQGLVTNYFYSSTDNSKKNTRLFFS
jgi:hypothetical protein